MYIDINYKYIGFALVTMTTRVDVVDDKKLASIYIKKINSKFFPSTSSTNIKLPDQLVVCTAPIRGYYWLNP